MRAVDRVARRLDDAGVQRGGQPLGHAQADAAQQHDRKLEGGIERKRHVFDFLDDWSDRYEHIIETGKKLPPMPHALETEATRVHGCQSTVYMHSRKKPGTSDILEFLASSDAEIVRGELALLQKVYGGQRAADILAFDVQAFFARLGLDKHLTMGRRNGLAEMVKRLRNFAAELAGKQPTTPLK